MSPLTGPVIALALVLFAAGTAKLATPAGTVPALAAVRLPASETAVRLLGTVEIVIGAAVVAFGGAWSSALVAVAFAGFAVFSAALLRSAGRQASCGCFGARSEPVTGAHVAVNLVAAALAVAGVVWPPPPTLDVLGELGWAAPAFVLLAVALAWLVRATLTVLPELQVAMRP